MNEAIENYAELWELLKDAEAQIYASQRVLATIRESGEKWKGETKEFAERLESASERADMLKLLLDCYEGIAFCSLKKKHKYQEPEITCEHPEIEMTLDMKKEQEIYYNDMLPEISKELSEWRKELAREYEFEIPEDEITDADIERARQYPIENLIEVGRNYMAKCVSHDDKNPSMYCKNNYAYCFSCGYTGDAIDIAQKIWGCDFPAAVRRLR